MLTERIYSKDLAMPHVPPNKIQDAFSNPLFKVDHLTHSATEVHETLPKSSDSIACNIESAPKLAQTSASVLCLQNDVTLDKSFDSVLSTESSFSKRKSERTKKQTAFYGK